MESLAKVEFTLHDSLVDVELRLKGRVIEPLEGSSIAALVPRERSNCVFRLGSAAVGAALSNAAPADKTSFLCLVLRRRNTNGFIGEFILTLTPGHSGIGTERDAGTEMIVYTQALRMAPTEADTDTGTNTQVTVQ